MRLEQASKAEVVSRRSAQKHVTTAIFHCQARECGITSPDRFSRLVDLLHRSNWAWHPVPEKLLSGLVYSIDAIARIGLASSPHYHRELLTLTVYLKIESLPGPLRNRHCI